MRTKTRRWVAIFVVLCVGGAMTAPAHSAPDKKKEGKKAEKKTKMPKSVFDISVKDIDGKAVDLSKFRDQVLMVVNVASQ